MSTTYTCDWCGEQIECHDRVTGVASLHVNGLHTDHRFVTLGQTGRHYHAGESDDDSCFAQAVALLDSHAGSRASGQREERRQHSAAMEQLGEINRRSAAWNQLPLDERKHRVLNVFGSSRLSMREMVAVLRQANPDFGIYPDGYLRRVLAELLASGDLARERQPRIPGGTAWRWAYYRPEGLSPDLQALQAALDDQEVA